jgi:hypothetical protein
MVQFEITLDANGKPNVKFAYNTNTSKLEEKVLAKFANDAAINTNKIVMNQSSANGITTITLSVVSV